MNIKYIYLIATTGLMLWDTYIQAMIVYVHIYVILQVHSFLLIKL